MKKKITVTVCDICQADDVKTKPYRIALPDQRLRTVDLCTQHAKPLTKLSKDIEDAKPQAAQPAK